MNAHLKSSNQLKVEVFMARIGTKTQPLPLKPEIPNAKTRVLRARLMLEECLETIRNGLGVNVDVLFDFSDGGFQEPGGTKRMAVKMSHMRFMPNGEPDLVEIADGLADQEVVNLGTAASCGLAHQPFFDEVMNNNFEKFGPGHKIDKGGKLIKPPDHKKPKIGREIVSQGFERGAMTLT